MIHQKWKLRLEFQTDDGFVDGLTQTNIELVGEHNDALKRPVNECIAIDIANLIQMFLENGSVSGASDINQTAEAFLDTINDLRESR